jgi:hypothetical protein
MPTWSALLRLEGRVLVIRAAVERRPPRLRPGRADFHVRPSCARQTERGIHAAITAAVESRVINNGAFKCQALLDLAIGGQSTRR